MEGENAQSERAWEERLREIRRRAQRIRTAIRFSRAANRAAALKKLKTIQAEIAELERQVHAPSNIALYIALALSLFLDLLDFIDPIFFELGTFLSIPGTIATAAINYLGVSSGDRQLKIKVLTKIATGYGAEFIPAVDILPLQTIASLWVIYDDRKNRQKLQQRLDELRIREAALIAALR
ncbi:MAG: hypothetical protein HYZ09_04310 [Candidatus Kerfeldbacteria bacterium]|nr:hypothetical protein [Candidatus Kerfeldbacteria bacterium]